MGEVIQRATHRPSTTGFVSAAVALIGLTCIVKLLSFAEKQVIAYKFGAASHTDAWFVALSVIMTLFLLTRELIEPAYLPIFMKRLEQGQPQKSWQLFSFMLTAILCLNLLVAIATFYSADTVTAMLGPGLSPQSRMLAADLIRISVFAGVLLALSSLTYITLNGLKRFAAPAAGDVALRAVSIGCIVALAADFGAAALAIAALLGAAARFGVHLLALRHKFPLLQWPSRECGEEIRLVSALMAPLAVGVLFAQVSELAANYFSSFAGAGAVSARTFARKIVDLPVLLVPYTLSVVAFPHFITLVNREDRDGLLQLLGDILLGIAFSFSALSIVIIVLAEPMVRILFERGAFDKAATEATAQILICYAAGLLAFGLEAVLVPLFFSTGDTKTPVLVGIFGVTIDVVLAALLVGSMGAAGVAAALAIAKSIKVVLLGVLLRRRQSAVPSASVGWAALRIATASAATAGFALILTRLWPAPSASASLAFQVWYCALISVSCITVHLMVVSMMRGPEWHLLVRWLAAARRWPARAPVSSK
jgi:putative peptidoglycan lipid II flippase